MDIRALILRDYPNLVFISISAITSFLALRPSPSLVPIVLTLTTLLLYARIFVPSPHASIYGIVLWFAIASGGTLSRMTASLDALSTPTFSVATLFCLSAVTSLLTLGAVYIDTKVCTRLPSPWSQITLFPALWTSLWFGVSYVSPVGRLSAWSPVEGIGSYDWILQLVGSPGIDWVVAAWAVVCSQAIGVWFIGSEGKEDEEPLIAHEAPALEQPSHLSHTGSSLLLAALLATLATLPSFFNNFPLAVVSADTTPFSVGCVLPPYQRFRGASLTLKDYIHESDKFKSSAKILLWPEGAVTFNSEAERDEGFAEVQKSINGTAYIGVSFEEAFSDKHSGSRRSLSKRTGLAIISHWSAEPHLVYYKRHLVPVAESFSLTHSTLPPDMFTLELPPPKPMNKTDWAPGPNYTRPIPITTSICLDFADPLPFAELTSRPALILGPARTWDISVGYAMWQQAKQRAEEVGSMVLWCDGGDGGVSGIAGGGFSDFTQVGFGSWVRTIGIQYPFQERRTPFAYLGNITMLLFWALVMGGSLKAMFGHLPQVGLFIGGLERVRKLLGPRGTSEPRHTVEEGNLLD